MKRMIAWAKVELVLALLKRWLYADPREGGHAAELLPGGGVS
jgi:hypothetical protein